MTRRQRRMVLIGGLVAGVAIAVSLALFAFREMVELYVQPSEVIAGKAPVDRTFRLGGMVRDGSVKRAQDDLEVKFVVTDYVHCVPVTYRGILPDLFREGQGIVAIGSLNGGVFKADQVLAKHDETYMPPEVAKGIKQAQAQPKPTSPTCS